MWGLEWVEKAIMAYLVLLGIGLIVVWEVVKWVLTHVHLVWR